MSVKEAQLIRIMELRGTYKGGGGPDKTILLSATKHDKKRFFILVTYLRDPKDKEFQIKDKAKKLGINYIEVYDRRLLDIRCILELNKLLKSYHIDILHAHDDKTLLYGWLLKLLNPKLKIIYTCHSHPNYNRKDFDSFIKFINYRIRKFIRLFLIKRFQKPIIVVSKATKKLLVKDNLKENDIIVLYNGIDVNFWKKKNNCKKLKKELGLKNNEFLVGTVARIDYDKDFPTFFKVVKLVTAQVPNVKFVVVGDGKGNELYNTKIMAKKMGLEGTVFFTGHRNDLLDIYSSFDLFLMTSLSEGLPNTVLEAMSMEVPVVSTAVGGVPELVINGETGYLCQVGDVKSLAEKIVYLLKNKALHTQFAQAGRKRVITYFSFEERIKKIEKIYEYFLNK